ncbi:hypothetical protein L3X38_003138 [Prunus dulcis]|uniref:Uncharacterized protein n=1 Tax=Prunus dulcis TaxID=3755 RepID=A0AAD4ZLH4_PRUDU|nr:hypothetical protein L3X38_003138 [Prunus dulcis]
MRTLQKGPLLESLNAKGVGNLDICSESVMEIKMLQKLKYANQVEEIGILFYACNAVTDVKENHSWYIDSGCSNHMTGDESLLFNIVTPRDRLRRSTILSALGPFSLPARFCFWEHTSTSQWVHPSWDCSSPSTRLTSKFLRLRSQ